MVAIFVENLYRKNAILFRILSRAVFEVGRKNSCLEEDCWNKKNKKSDGMCGLNGIEENF